MLNLQKKNIQAYLINLECKKIRKIGWNAIVLFTNWRQYFSLQALIICGSHFPSFSCCGIRIGGNFRNITMIEFSLLFRLSSDLCSVCSLTKKGGERACSCGIDHWNKNDRISPISSQKNRRYICK